MPRKPKPTPHRTCQQCGSVMERNRYGGVIEDLGRFNKRKFCNQQCMAANMEGKIKVMSAKASRRQATKTVATACSECGDTHLLGVHHRDENPLNNAPDNLTTLCQSCHMKGHWRVWKTTTRPETTCSHCEQRARWNGMCGKHWQRFKKYGDAVLKKVWRDGKRVLVRDDDGCRASVPTG